MDQTTEPRRITPLRPPVSLIPGMLSAFLPAGMPFAAQVGQWSLLFAGAVAVAPLVVLPLAAMMLKRRNEGRLPAWLETRIAAWPP